VVRELEAAYLELARPPGEAAERVRVSATGRELVEHVVRALDQDVRLGTLTLERRGGKQKAGNEKQEIAVAMQRGSPPSNRCSAECLKTIPRTRRTVQQKAPIFLEMGESSHERFYEGGEGGRNARCE